MNLQFNKNLKFMHEKPWPNCFFKRLKILKIIFFDYYYSRKSTHLWN